MGSASATTICSDKTGTTTLNQMTVVKAYIGNTEMDPSCDTSRIPVSVSSLLDESISHNTAGIVFLSKDGGLEISGSPTEKAILSWAVQMGMIFDAVRSESIVHAAPFNCTKKRGGVAVQAKSRSHVHSQEGTTEMIVDSCTAYMNVNGHLKPIDNDKEFYSLNAGPDSTQKSTM